MARWGRQGGQQHPEEDEGSASAPPPAPAAPSPAATRRQLRPARPARPVPPPGLDHNERLAGYAAAVLCLVLTVVVWTLRHSGSLHLGLASYGANVGLALGVAGAALLAGATLWNKRIALGAVALLVGYAGPWPAKYIYIGFPFLALALWELMRWSRRSRVRTEERRAEKAAERSRSGGRNAPGRGGAGQGSGRSRGRRSQPSPFPEASKRYTPPKPRRPAPPPPEKPAARPAQ